MVPTPIHVPDVTMANSICFAVLGILLALTFRKSAAKTSWLSLDDTNELKGLAMISIVAIHIGYSLVDNALFLSPLSRFAGVSVDMFLLLSGYGLTMSMIKKKLSIIEFYRQRLIRLAIPFWIILTALLILDRTILGQSYEWQTILQSYALFFPSARIWEDINSPFWYMTWLVFFYLLFPIVFIAKRVWLSGLILFIFSFFWTRYNPLDMDANWLHMLHIAAFPIGVSLASLVAEKGGLVTYLADWRTRWSMRYQGYIVYPVLITLIYGLSQIQPGGVVENIGFLQSIDYSARYVEQIQTILICLCFVILFFWKPWKNIFLGLFGLYSFEIYLIHWPLISRYDFLYQHLPVPLATLLSYAGLLGLAFLVQKGIRKISLLSS